MLAIEAAAAAILAFVPGVLWVLWFGVGGGTRFMVEGSVQPLATAWVGIVVLRGFHQWRRTDLREESLDALGQVDRDDAGRGPA